MSHSTPERLHRLRARQEAKRLGSRVSEAALNLADRLATQRAIAVSSDGERWFIYRFEVADPNVMPIARD